MVFVCLVCLCSKVKDLLGQSAKNHGNNHNIIDNIYSVLLHYEVLKIQAPFSCFMFGLR